MAVDIKEYLSPPILIIIFLLILSLMFVFPVLKMIILGAILAYGIRPISLKIQSKLKYSSVSILLAMVIVLIPLVLLVGYITYELSSLITTMLASSSYMEFNSSVSQLVTYLQIDGDPTSISTYLNNSFESISSFLLNYSATALSKFANITIDLFILVCSIFYFVRDGEGWLNFIKDFVPDESKGFFDSTVESVRDVLKSIFYGHFLTSVIIGIFACIGYSILGFPFGIFLGVITGILQLIPVFGPWPIYWALFFIDLIGGNYPRAIIVLLFGFFLSTVDMYIRPALSSHYADIHPLILLVGFLSGPLVYGIVGFIVGPLILGVTYAVLDSYRKEYLLGDV